MAAARSADSLDLYWVRVIAYNWCWVSRGDVPWNVSTQPTFYN